MRKLYTTSLFLVFFGLLTNFTTLAQVDAVDDTFSVVYGASNVTAGNILLNDTLNGPTATLSTVTITQLTTTNPGVSISGTNVVVAGGTPRGTYTLTYKICSIANSLLCDTATVTINTQLLANPDTFYSYCYNSYAGNVLGFGSDLNYVDTLNGVPAILVTYTSQPDNVVHPADVVLTVLQDYPGIVTINPNGDVILLQGMNQGNFVLTYQLCEIAHPTNCAVGYVNVFVNGNQIIASDDDFFPNPIDNTIGGIAGNIFSNDFSTCNGQVNEFNSAIVSSYVPPGVTINPNGDIFVAIGTSPGTYVINYTVCANFGGCASATAYVYITGVSALAANYDDFSAPNYPNTTTASVLNNDTYNGAPFSPSAVLLTPINNTSGFTLNANGTITIASTVPEGVYTVPYQICVASNPQDCFVNYAYVVVLKNRILGKIKFDANANGCDASDVYLNNISVKNLNGSNTNASTTSSYFGSQYYLIGDSGTNTVSVTGLPSYFTVTPATQVFSFSTPGSTTAPDFCVTSNSNVDDLEIVLVPLFNIVPGLPALYNIWFKNNGSTTLSGQITFQFDNTKMSFLTSSPSPNTITTNTVVYNYTNIAPFESRLINNVKFQVATPPTVNNGNVIPFSGSISPVAADNTPVNNVSLVNQTAVNSQDPNDIVVHEGATIQLAQAQQGYLHYTIRFQNVGTSDAINIKVVNDLDAKLDWSTFQLVSTSHNCRVKNKNGHNEFLFEGINLPGASNEPLSHGYISYKVRPISSIAVGNVIPNTANIYFDYNAPIATNIASTTVINNLRNENFAFNNFNYFPNPVKNSLSISNDTTIEAIEITSVLGQKMFSRKVNELQTEINLSDLSNGVYFVKVTSEGQEKIVKIVKE